MTTIKGPAYRIETARLVIRCWEPKDAYLLDDAISSSLDHLRPWMPWAREEPKPIEEKIQLLRRFRGEFDLGRDFVYGIFSPDESIAIGGTGLHTRRGWETREIGYWIRADKIRQGLGSEATIALVKVAFEIDRVLRVEIRFDPDNLPSGSIPRKLGFTQKGIIHGDPDFPGDGRDTEIWQLAAEVYPNTPARAAEIRAFDALGRLISLDDSGE